MLGAIFPYSDLWMCCGLCFSLPLLVQMWRATISDLPGGFALPVMPLCACGGQADVGGGGDPGWAAALGDALYELGQTANSLVQGQIQGGLTLTR
jgi:hypothetical protein